MIIGLTNARIKFHDVADLVHYLMNSDEDFDEAEFAFDWSEVDPEDLENINFNPYEDAVDLIHSAARTNSPRLPIDPDSVRSHTPFSSQPASTQR